jgi:hypothetical protein
MTWARTCTTWPTCGVWLDGLRDDLTRITAPADARRPAGSPAT